jgi:cell division protein FtsW
VAGIGFDKPLLFITLALCFLGLLAVFSASATEAADTYGNSLYFALRQLIFYVAGFALMISVSKFPFFHWPRFTRLMAVVVIGLLLYTLHGGVSAYGAERWIRIFGLQFQPSEAGKISAVLLLAQALSTKTSSRKSPGFLINLVLIAITMMLIFKQPNLSMTIILAVVSGAMMFIAGISPFILALVGGGGGTYVVYKLLHTPYQLRRIQGWLNPWKDPQDTGYNLIQSLYAIGSGGFLGRGLGMSHQKLYYLPFQYTDFIFAVWAEEWGLLGSMVLIGLFVALLYRGFVIARTSRSDYGQLLAMGITMILAAQMMINLCVATGLFPVTGVTLPLISYGGTSVMVTMLMIGILLNISRYRPRAAEIPDIRAAR